MRPSKFVADRLEYTTGVRADLSGMHAYTHLIRAAEDPERPEGKRKVRFPHLVMKDGPAAYAEQIDRHLRDRVPRTFNRICVELWGVTADVAHDDATEALWDLVEEGRVEHTLMAPIYFRTTTTNKEGTR